MRKMSMVYETEDGIFIEVADSLHPREPRTSHFLVIDRVC